jgi:hypothetical protein
MPKKLGNLDDEKGLEYKQIIKALSPEKNPFYIKEKE